MTKPRIVLADDRAELLETIEELLRPHVDVVGLAQNGEQAVSAAASLDPDILVLDVSMPVLDGFHVASRLRDSGSRAKLIFLSIYQHRDYVEAAFAVGAAGYVMKSRIASDLLPAIEEVLQGGKFVSPPSGRSTVTSEGRLDRAG